LAKEMAAPVETATVSFPQAQQEIFVFDPLVGTAPIATYTNFSDIQVEITDHPLIVETGPLPVDPTTLVVTETLANDTGLSSTDGITSDPTLKGTGAANAVVTLTIDGAAEVTTTADATGNWIYTPQGLVDGVHTVVASETGPGNIAEASLTFTLYSRPTITSVVASGAATQGPTTLGNAKSREDSHSQTITTGETIAITLGVSHPVNVAAPPLLLLNDCATATYDATLSTQTALVFDYTVGSRQWTGDLTVSGIELASPGSITDVAGNLADLTGAGAILGLRVNGGATGLAGPSRGFVPIYGTSDAELFGPSRCRAKFEPGSTGTLRLDDSALSDTSPTRSTRAR
jgi:hypothetical protein